MAVDVAGTSRDSLGHLLDDGLRAVMHEIRQPVSVVLALAEAARGAPGVTPEVHGYLDRIIEQVQELAGTATSVLFPPTASDDSPATPIDVDEVVDSVLDAVRVTWSGTLRRGGLREGHWTSEGSRAQLRRCLLGVVDNAARAAGPDGTVTVSAHRGPEGVRIVVEDDGPGFGLGPRGAGLGLLITRQTLAAIGAGLTVGPAPAGVGSRVVLCLRAERTGPVGDPVRAG
jgi:signal transduction histidine kinase